MDLKQMLILRQLLEASAALRKAEEGRNHPDRDNPGTDGSGRVYYLSGEERASLRCLDEEANLGENYRLDLLRLARLADIEPAQLLYLRRLAGLGVTAIE